MRSIKPGVFAVVCLTAPLLGACVKRQSTVSAPPPPSCARTFYVATNGNDQWSGTLPSPLRKNTDGPFASLSAALAAVRREKQMSAGYERAPTIVLRNG